MAKRYCYITFSVDDNGDISIKDVFSSEEEANEFCVKMNEKEEDWIFRNEVETGMQKSFYDENWEDAMAYFEKNDDRCMLFRKRNPKYKGFTREDYAKWSNIVAANGESNLAYDYLKKEIL